MDKRVGFTLLLPLLFTASSAQVNRPLTVVFGPAAEEPSRLAAQAAAAVAVEWLKSPGATVELLRPGVSETQELMRYMKPKEFEDAFLGAARSGRESDLFRFVNTLDRATFAANRRPGRRVLIVIVESPSPALAATMKGGALELASRLAQTLDFCKSHSISVVVIDPSDASKDSAAALKSLASDTGGALVRDPNALSATISKVGPAETAPAGREAAKAQAGSRPELGVYARLTKPEAGAPGLTVHTSFFRTYPMRAVRGSDLGPMTGLLLVQAPMDGLEFQTDRSNYLSRARITQVIRDAEGKVVWEAKKEVTVKGPVRKLQARKTGNLCYMREVKLPAADYVLEGAVEDLVSGKSAQTKEALHATGSVPGLAVSDVLFVRKLDNSIDKFEADQVLSYDGTALSPMLKPVFSAGQSSNLQLYFVMYPDYRGVAPKITLEFRRDGQTVGSSELAFTDKLRNTAGEGQASDRASASEQKHEFPYLADIRGITFEPGSHEAHVTVRQGASSITRIVPFRVVGDQ